MSLTEIEFRDKVVTELKEIRENQRVIVEQVEEINIILHGSEKLGVAPLDKQVRELWTAYDRVKWPIGSLGIANIVLIIIWIFNQIQQVTP